MLRRLIAGLVFALFLASPIEAADQFVWDGTAGSGCTEGECWEFAWTTLCKDWDAELTAATDFVYVRQDHQETESAADCNITGSTAEGSNSFVRILTVVGDDTGTTPGNLATMGGSSGYVRTTDGGTYHIKLHEKLWMYGVKLESGRDFYLAYAGTDAHIYCENCKTGLTFDNGLKAIFIGSWSKTVYVHLVDTELTFANAGQGLHNYGGVFLMEGGSIDTALTYLVEVAAMGSPTVFRGVDLSSISGTLVKSSSIDASHYTRFERCALHADVTITDAIDQPDVTVRVLNSSSYTGSNPESRFEEYHYQGEIVLSTTDYLDDATDGATDGTNKYSWEWDTFAGSNVLEIYEPLCSKTPIATWVAGGSSVTATIYASGPSGKNTDAAWIKWEYRSTDSSNSAQSEWTNDRADPGDHSTALTADTTHSGDWTNGGASKYKFTHTATYDKDGVLYAWPCVSYLTGDGTNTFFISPRIVQ